MFNLDGSSNLKPNDYSDVVKFISHFKGSEETFLNGCCYWFAQILVERFDSRGYVATIFHEPVEGHFITRLIKYTGDNLLESEERFFDIRGDVTDLYKDKYLEDMDLMSFNEERRWGRLLCDCKFFIGPEDYPYWLRES